MNNSSPIPLSYYMQTLSTAEVADLNAFMRDSKGIYAEDLEKAVLVHAPDTILGIRSEYEYIRGMHGQRDEGWSLESQILIKRNGKIYDVLSVKLRGGEIKRYCFDITGFCTDVRVLTRIRGMP